MSKSKKPIKHLSRAEKYLAKEVDRIDRFETRVADGKTGEPSILADVRQRLLARRTVAIADLHEIRLALAALDAKDAATPAKEPASSEKSAPEVKAKSAGKTKKPKAESKPQAPEKASEPESAEPAPAKAKAKRAPAAKKPAATAS